MKSTKAEEERIRFQSQMIYSELSHVSAAAEERRCRFAAIVQCLYFDSVFEKMLEIHSWICYNRMKSFVKGEGQAWIYPALNI